MQRRVVLCLQVAGNLLLTQLSSHLPRYVHAKFRFSWYIITWFVIINSGSTQTELTRSLAPWSWVLEKPTVSQLLKNFNILRNLKFHYRIHKSPPLVPILSQMKVVLPSELSCINEKKKLDCLINKQFATVIVLLLDQHIWFAWYKFKNRPALPVGRVSSPYYTKRKVL
jgi:hypothetical protein